METKRATPRDESNKGETGQTVKKVFVGGLKDQISDEDLKTYFSEFGEVNHEALRETQLILGHKSDEILGRVGRADGG